MNDDDEISNYNFMANYQSEELINSDLNTFMSYDKLYSTSNQLMDDFHKVSANYFSISNEKANLIKVVSCLKKNHLSLTKEKEFVEKENESLKQELAF